MNIDPAAWSFTYRDYWGTTVTTFELHERHSRLTVHAEAVVETRGDEVAWDVERRVAQNDLGWPALQDRGVTDSMSEYLTRNRLTEPPAELSALAQERSEQPARLAALDICRLVHERISYARGSTDGDQHGRGGVGGRPRGLPGLLPPEHRGAALDRDPRPLRLGLPASRRAGRTHATVTGRATPGWSGGAGAG